jgi:hypothetical protein
MGSAEARPLAAHAEKAKPPTGGCSTLTGILLQLTSAAQNVSAFALSALRFQRL